MNLYNQIRPQTLKGFYGNKLLKRTIKTFFENDSFPNNLLFHGPFGTGKTTLARIIAKKLKVSKSDVFELNIGDVSGVDNIRKLIEESKSRPLLSKKRMYILDEVQGATKQAFEAMLKFIENCGSHNVIVLCTTEVDKIPKGIISRCHMLKVQPLSLAEMKSYLQEIGTQHFSITISDDLAEAIWEAAEGSPRNATNALEVAATMPEEDRISYAKSLSMLGDSSAEARELFSALLKEASWEVIVPLIRGIKEDHEVVRRACLGYMSAVLLNQKSKNKFSKRVALILELFSNNWYNEGRAGLILTCFALCER